VQALLLESTNESSDLVLALMHYYCTNYSSLVFRIPIGGLTLRPISFSSLRTKNLMEKTLQVLYWIAVEVPVTFPIEVLSHTFCILIILYFEKWFCLQLYFNVFNALVCNNKFKLRGFLIKYLPSVNSIAHTGMGPTTRNR